MTKLLVPLALILGLCGWTFIALAWTVAAFHGWRVRLDFNQFNEAWPEGVMILTILAVHLAALWRYGR